MASPSYGHTNTEERESVNRRWWLIPSNPTHVLATRERWACTLVGRFVDFQKNSTWHAQRELQDCWDGGGYIRIERVKILYLFLIEKKVARDLFLAGNPWNLCGALIIFSALVPNTPLHEHRFDVVPIWIQLRRLSFKYFNADDAELIGLAAGQVLAVSWSPESRRQYDPSETSRPGSTEVHNSVAGAAVVEPEQPVLQQLEQTIRSMTREEESDPSEDFGGSSHTAYVSILSVSSDLSSPANIGGQQSDSHGSRASDATSASSWKRLSSHNPEDDASHKRQQATTGHQHCCQNHVETSIEQCRDWALRDELDQLLACEEQYWAQRSGEQWLLYEVPNVETFCSLFFDVEMIFLTTVLIYPLSPPYPTAHTNGHCDTTSRCPLSLIQLLHNNFDHWYRTNAAAARKSGHNCFANPSTGVHKKIVKDWQILRDHLPDMIYVRVYEQHIDLLRAVIIGPP
ncbi:hypothetical protein RJ640_001382 [Escallonia rubra]|uniref:DUF4283 domain-containing protein n=1 Tax=Escallonia rubra TaxID=112253 RepID=A0AA88S5B9_9ASTE|nr:hypothetical protein RJ640_001382 [Escallonia rubra]